MDDSILKNKKINTITNRSNNSSLVSNVVSMEKSEANFVNFEPDANNNNNTNNNNNNNNSLSNKNKITNASSLSLLTSHMIMSSSSSLLDTDSSKKMVISKVFNLNKTNFTLIFIIIYAYNN